ncbi:MAG: hypothetical protein QOF13_2552 [Solirubrobacterales bacterium]|jgi:hypothetical protein|nr:hypothetical protein [Solirubrobacterales bacterium]
MISTFATPVLAASPPAGGATLGQVAIASLAATLLTAALLYIGFGYRAGRLAWLRRFAARVERFSGYPAWVGIPVGIATTSLLIALFGMYWDISLHIDVGRDPGPLANPAHYFILAGLFGIFTAGFLAMVLPEGKPSETAVRLGPDWHAPLGGVLICACGAFSLIGFPLDDIWHRLFGQDVTLWGPTHLMLIGGAAMTLIGIGVLTVEGIRARSRRGTVAEHRQVVLARTVASTGGLLLGLSTFQAEFDFGVPQFSFLFEPMMIMLAAGVGLVAARLYAGRGAALGAVLFFLLARGTLALLIGPVLGETTPHMPLYIVEALVVEAVALRVPSERPLAFGLWSGLGIGTVGLASEWAWSHVWMPIPWPSALFPEVAMVGLAIALAASALGAWIGTRLSPEPGRRRPGLRLGACAGAATIAAATVLALNTSADEGVRAQVALHDVSSGPQREVSATVTLTPRDAAEDAAWFDVTAWQGGGLAVDPLERVGPGTYRTTEPIPVGGNWKTMIRLHSGGSLTAVPIFLPGDAAIPAPEVPAKLRFTRRFVDETQLLQREKTGGAPALVAAAYATVAGIAFSLLALLAWSLHRLAFPPRPGLHRSRRKAPASSTPALQR